MEISQPLRLVRFERGQTQSIEGRVVREGLVRLHVNGIELARLMCTPQHLDWLALGFLCSQGIVQDLRRDVRRVVICPSEACVEVWLQRADFEPPGQPILTSGCGGGVTFADVSEGVEPVVSSLKVGPGQLARLIGAMLAMQETRGVHTSALAAGEVLLAVSEDVGRHNTIDKLWGYCLMHGIPTQDRILLSTGRISSEMLNKAARMGVPVVASRTSPTSLSVALARTWNMTLVGYLRRDSLNVYSGQERIVEDEEEHGDANV